MNSTSGPLLRLACLLVILGSFQTISAQWHVYCFRDTFYVPMNTSSTVDVLANDDLSPPPTANNYVPNPVASDYPYVHGALLTENGGTLAIPSTGNIFYTPPPNAFTGIDRFYYSVADASTPGYPVDTALVVLFVGPTTPLDPASAPSVQLWPNPAQNFLRVQTPGHLEALTVFGLDGRKVASGGEQVDVSKLASGVYVARLQVDGQLLHRRFVKE